MMQLGEHATIQVCNHKSMQVFKYKGMCVCNYAKIKKTTGIFKKTNRCPNFVEKFAPENVLSISSSCMHLSLMQGALIN